MSEVLFVAAGFTTQLNKRTKVDEHPLWGSECLLINVQNEIDTHREFLRCGVDVMITNTYQASIEGFKAHLGLNESESYNLMKKSVSHCREAIRIEKQLRTIDEDKRILIAGAVGSYGAYLADGSEYHGNFINECHPDDIEKWHRPRIQALVDGGVDILAFETIPALKEAEILIKLLNEYPKTKAWISFSCKDEYHIAHGERFLEVAEKCWSLNSTQIIAIGVNCLAAEIATKLISQLGTCIPSITYPNCGKMWDAVNKVWVDQGESKMIEDYVEKWCEIGVKFIGGCCGTSIEARIRMKSIIDNFNKKIKKS